MLKSNKHLTIVGAVTGVFSLVLLFQNCSDVRFAEVPIVQRNCVPSPQDDCIRGVPGEPFTKTYTINNQGEKKADILFVVDASGSMNYEQTQIQNRFEGFIQSLQGINWRVAITTTIMKDAVYAGGPLKGQTIPGTTGRLLQFTDAPANTYFIDSTMPQANQYFVNTIRRPQSCGFSGFGDNCDDHERGIYQTNLVIMKQAEHNFFRPGADANIVIVSDENERSNGKNLEDLDQPAVLVANANALLPSRSFTVHSIITDTEDCRRGEGAKIGTVYREVSMLTNGVVGSVCSNDYTTELSLIADNIFQTTKSLNLPCIIEGNITLTSTPALDASYMYEISGTKLNFNKDLPNGVTITISGNCAPL